MAIDYTKETKKVLDGMKEVRLTTNYFPKLLREGQGRLREKLTEGYVEALTGALKDLNAALAEWEAAGAEIFEEKTETKCGMAAGFQCDICADYDCESNPEGKA